MIHENVWMTYGSNDLAELEKISAGYIDFLSNGKTERECTELIVTTAKDEGEKDLI